MMKRPSLNALRTFEAVGRWLSFTDAAADLNISQAAVSQQIRKLEDYLGCELFIRQHRRLTFTSIGQAYYKVVHETIDRLNTITDQLFPQNKNSLITISCSPSIATMWLVPHLSEIKKSHTEIEIRVNTLDNLRLVLPSGPDLEIKMQTEPDGDKRTINLMSVEIFPVCSPRLLSTKLKIECASFLLNYPLIHVLGYDDDWYRWFKQFNVEHHTLSGGLSFDASLMALEATLRGEGIMLGRRPFIDDYLNSGELVKVFSEPMYLKSYCFLYVTKTGKMNPHVKTVVEWLKKIAAQSPLSCKSTERDMA